MKHVHFVTESILILGALVSKVLDIKNTKIDVGCSGSLSTTIFYVNTLVPS